MSVLSRDALQDSPLADLHEIASALGIDGYRRQRKDDLIDTILERQGGDTAAAAGTDDAAAEERPARSRSRRGGRGRTRRTDDAADDADASAEPAADDEPAEERPARSRSRRRGGSDTEGDAPARPRGGRDRDRDRGEDEDEGAVVEGVVEILANGSGFVRAGEGEDDADVYVSAAQVRRCDLVSGDRIAGPVRRPRRSERFASLVRVETINGTPAEEVSAGTPYDDLPAVFPTDVVAFTAKDPTLKQISDLAPFGRGSRVTVIGGPGSGRTTTLRALAIELAALEGVELHVVLAGARPEELPEWAAAELPLAASTTLAASDETQAQAVEQAVDAAKRAVARGGHAAVVIDALDTVSAHVARRVLAAARNVPDGGSLTIVAAARGPIGGETTIIGLDSAAVAVERRPVVDAHVSATLRVEVLVGARKATTIAKNRAKAVGGAE